jgi:hypothetical protein
VPSVRCPRRRPAVGPGDGWNLMDRDVQRLTADTLRLLPRRPILARMDLAPRHDLRVAEWKIGRVRSQRHDLDGPREPARVRRGTLIEAPGGERRLPLEHALAGRKSAWAIRLNRKDRRLRHGEKGARARSQS